MTKIKSVSLYTPPSNPAMEKINALLRTWIPCNIDLAAQLMENIGLSRTVLRNHIIVEFSQTKSFSDTKYVGGDKKHIELLECQKASEMIEKIDGWEVLYIPIINPVYRKYIPSYYTTPLPILYRSPHILSPGDGHDFAKKKSKFKKVLDSIIIYIGIRFILTLIYSEYKSRFFTALNIFLISMTVIILLKAMGVF